MTEVEELRAIEQIKALKAAYFRCMDLKLWDEFATLFTPDASFDVRGALDLPRADDSYDEPVVVGVEAIVAYVKAGLNPIVSVHGGHMPEIAIADADSATGLWPMHDMLIAPPGGPFRRFRGWGHYTETYRRQDGRWRIATLRLRRLHVEID